MVMHNPRNIIFQSLMASLSKQIMRFSSKSTGFKILIIYTLHSYRTIWLKFMEFVINELKKDELKELDDIVGKGENSDYKHFLLFPLCFQKSI